MGRELWIRLDLSELLVDHRLAELSDEALGAALRICAKTIRTGGSIPKGSKILARNQRIADELVSDGFLYEHESGDFRSPWLDEKLAETQAFIDKQRAAGRASALNRRSTTVQPPFNQAPTTVEPLVEVYTSSNTDRPTDRPVSPTDRPTDKQERVPAPRKRSAGSQRPDTWLTPFAEVWSVGTGGGVMPYGEAAKYLHPLVTRAGPEAVARALARYLTETDGQYISLSHFSKGFGKWAGTAPVAPRRTLDEQRTDSIFAQLLAEGEEQKRIVEAAHGSG